MLNKRRLMCLALIDPISSLLKNRSISVVERAEHLRLVHGENVILTTYPSITGKLITLFFQCRHFLEELGIVCLVEQRLESYSPRVSCLLARFVH
jgi:hypothetical protein